MKRRVVSIGLIVLLAVSVWGSMPVGKVRAAACTSNGTGGGNWSAPGAWTGCNGTTPQSADTVTIKNGDTVTLDASPTIAGLTVGEGSSGVLSFDSTARTLMVSGNVIVNSGAQFITQSSGAQVHSVLIGGNLTNNGTFDMSRGGTTLVANVTFNGVTNQTVGGSGGTTRFNLITINNTGSAPDNIVEIASNNFAVPSSFLTLTSGIFKLSNNFSLTLSTGNYTVAATAGLWVNGGTVHIGTTSGSLLLNGRLRVSSGMLNIGNISGNSLNYATGSTIIIEGGSINIAGRLARNSSGSTTSYNQSGGAVTLVTVGSTSSSDAGFDLNRSGSSFTMSGGTIIVQRATSNASGDYFVAAGTVNVTGGTLQVGNASSPDAATIRINSTAPVWNLAVNGSAGVATKPTAQFLTNGLTVGGNATVDAGTTLDLGSNTLTVNGTITNTGTLRQTQPVNNTTVEFLHIQNATHTTDKYFGVDITTASNLGDTTVTVMGNQKCAEANGLPVKRCFTIDRALASGDTLKLYYTDAELQGQTETNIHVWQYAGSGTNWTEATGTRSNDASANFVQVILNMATAANRPYALKETTPAAVKLASFTATRAGDHTVVAWETASELHNLGFNVWRGTSADAPDVRLNQQVIPSQAPGGADGFAYSYRDFDTAGEAHGYYWLEDVDLNGTVTRHGPVAAAVDAPTAVRLTALQANRPSPAWTWVGLPAAVGLTGVGVVMGLRRYWIKRSK